MKTIPRQYSFFRSRLPQDEVEANSSFQNYNTRMARRQNSGYESTDGMYNEKLEEEQTDESVEQ